MADEEHRHLMREIFAPQGPSQLLTLTCECGWKITALGYIRALTEHSKHVDRERALARIGEEARVN